MSATADFFRNGFRIEADVFEGPRGPYRFRVMVDMREVVCIEGWGPSVVDEAVVLDALRDTLRSHEEDAADEDYDGRAGSAECAAFLRRVLA